MQEAERQRVGIRELIKRLQDVDRYRRALRPSSAAYQRAAAEIERLSRRIFEEEAAAEEEQASRQARLRATANRSPEPQP